MKQLKFLVILMLATLVGKAQAPSNYTNINGRYRWIAGMFDSTFHIPKGTTPSLRTGGSTNAGALFYKTGDSSLYIYSGNQWLKIAGAAGFVPYSGATQNVNLGIYELLAKSASITDTGGVAANIFQRTSINTDLALYAKAVGNRGFAAIIEQADSNATGTQYQTIFRKSMMPGTGNPANGAGVSWYTQISNDNNLNPAVSVYRARIIDTTGYASGLIRQTSTEFWTRKNNVWDTTLVLNGGNVGVNTGQNGIDSALTVANGTWLKRGVRMSALPTGVGTKALRIDATGNVSVADTLTNGVSGSLTTDFIPKATGTSTLGNSPLSVGAGVVGLGLGVVPPNAWTNYWALQLANGVALGSYNFSNIPIGWLGTNAYHDGMGDIRVSNGAANKYLQDRGNHKWFVAGSGTAGSYISFTQAMTLDSSNRLSIGTTTMDSMFKVAQGAYFQRGVRMSGLPTGAGTKAVRIDANGTLSTADTLTNGISGTGTTNYIPKFTSSSAIGNSIIYETGGLIGIGTTTPAEFVHIKSSSYGTPLYVEYSGGTSAYIGLANSGGRAYLVSNNNDLVFATSSSATERMRLTSSGNLGLGVTPSAWYTTFGTKAIQFAASGSIYGLDVSSSDRRAGLMNNAFINSSGNYAYINTGHSTQYEQNAGTHKWLTAPSGTAGNAISFTQAMTLDASGNLIVGGTSASGALNIYRGAGANAYFEIAGNGNTLGSTSVILGQDAGSVGYLWNRANNALSFGTNNTERARFNLSGELLINTTTDVGDFKLQVSGNSYISGNVGIGTTSPTVKLEIVGDYRQKALVGNSNGFNLTINSSTDVVSLTNFYNAAMTFGTNNAERMRITSGGNVGIGTTSPSALLTINNPTEVRFRMNIADVNQIILNHDGSTGIFRTESSTPLTIGTNGSERMRIFANGNIAVNSTTDAGYKLDVNGTGRFSGNLEIAATGGNSGKFYIDGTQASARKYLIENGITGISNAGFQIRDITGGFTPFYIASSGAATFSSSVTTGGDLTLNPSGNSTITQNASTGNYNQILFKVNGTTQSSILALSNALYFSVNGSNTALTIASNQAAEFSSSIKTGAPSGGTAAAWKLGERVASAGVTFNDQQYIQLDIGGTLYYLATVDLPMPEAYPQATSGPSNNYKITPVQVKTTKDVEIEKLRKELDELKQMIKNLNK